MSNRSRLFASVALPILAATVGLQPALADSLHAPFQVAQQDAVEGGQGGDNPEELRRKRREEHQREQQGEPGRAEQPQRRQAAPDAGQDGGPSDQQRQREERRKQREADQQQGGEQPQRRQAAPEAGQDGGPSAEERQRQREERRKQREADQQQQNGDEPAQGRPKPAAAQDGQQPSDAERQREERRKQRQAEQQQNGDQPAAEKPAPDKPVQTKPAQTKPAQEKPAQGKPAADTAAPGQDGGLSDAERQRIREERRKQREADQQQQNGDQPAPQKPAAGKPAPAGDKPVAPKPAPGQPVPQPAPDAGQDGQQPTDADRQRIREERRKQREADQQQQNGDQPARQPEGQPAQQPDGQAPRERPRPDQAGQNGANPGDARRPGGRGADELTPEEARDLEQMTPQQREQLREERRVRRDLPDISEQDRQRIARDPAKSDDTVVLPVENGAAVLDSDKDADSRGGREARERRRAEREQLREERGNVPLPKNDADAQAPMRERGFDRDQIDEALRERGRRVERAPQFDLQDAIDAFVGANQPRPRIEERRNNRTVIDFGDEIVVRGDDRARLRRDSQDTYYEELPRGRSREVIERPNGVRIVTIYNSYGDVIQRTRIDRDGREYLMVYADDMDDDRPRPPIYDAGEDLPPMRLRVPLNDYIVDTSSQPDRDYYSFLSEPPVERVERTYSIDEVRNSARLRDKVRRIDLDTITFATGSAEVPMSQAKTLRRVADAMMEVINKDPGETFLIEGHTDAVGSDESNLILSDERAESVASLLTEVYNIPPENLVTQGYGERYLKVLTNGPSQENRRVTIRRVTPLVRPVAQR
ncbi:hypothetical protein BJF92_11575 [Rhizobium rhizosphaerae]|uniref:OmpA family protein n=1 Tax=Xaviernesmea rhizosphaerae TaxID=1672749 RepID=A0A1Q9AN10_9HYPH|nr:OmpA family protein [Xaviernesmea rhizosphaerae]OLP56716.1 hypothetical protein BJF92_11575 [Xaviernesmea rhizosphaerae]